MRYRILLLLAALMLSAIDAGAKPRELPPEYAKQLTSLYHREIAELLLGIHGELFWDAGLNAPYMRNARGFAAKKEDGSGIELMFERDMKFILYANVSNDGVVTYMDTPEARALTGNGFCGIHQWPSEQELANPPEWGKIRVLAETPKNGLPVRPKNCKAVAYALTDGAFLFCQPDGVFSPYPLWLLHEDKNHMRLVPADGLNVTILEIEADKMSGQLIQYRNGWMKELAAPIKSPYMFTVPFRGICAPKTIMYVSPEYVSGQDSKLNANGDLYRHDIN